ncbi:RNA-directed DNA polymerase, eukaryota, reverse transcriptase zinc-binding domain protein, partial [Tanacetum coccineum]
KVNIFVWRALKGRLPVREELDKRGIDLDSVLSPICTNAVESCAHSLVTCDLAMSVWDKIFRWGALTLFLLCSQSIHFWLWSAVRAYNSGSKLGVQCVVRVCKFMVLQVVLVCIFGDSFAVSGCLAFGAAFFEG